ncbi:MAG TPA: MarR family transcriptional regulator [Beijerinckiaceae bacterium]|jgi:DNA-binding MarR family transcriptional regulator
MSQPAFDPLSLDAQLCFAVYSTAHAFTAAYKPFLEPLGLTYPQYLVLIVLWGGDGISVGEIGDKLHLDSGTLTPILKRMEKAGLVRRSRNPEDERQLKVELTPEGRAIREKVRPAREQVVCTLGGDETPIGKLRADLMQVNQMLRATKMG